MPLNALWIIGRCSKPVLRHMQYPLLWEGKLAFNALRRKAWNTVHRCKRMYMKRFGKDASQQPVRSDPHCILRQIGSLMLTASASSIHPSWGPCSELDDSPSCAAWRHAYDYQCIAPKDRNIMMHLEGFGNIYASWGAGKPIVVIPLGISSKESDNPCCQFSRHSLDN